jgi:hypothetical protein
MILTKLVSNVLAGYVMSFLCDVCWFWYGAEYSQSIGESKVFWNMDL